MSFLIVYGIHSLDIVMKLLLDSLDSTWGASYALSTYVNLSDI
jgi:hypothetical protein